MGVNQRGQIVMSPVEITTFIEQGRTGTMATIGRDRAVAMLFGVKLAGRLAWLFWLVAHIVFLAGFRNRATVFVNWIYHYLTYDLGLRAIVGRTRKPPQGDAQRGDAARSPSLRGSEQRSSDAA